MLIVPLQAVPNQAFRVQLNNQQCQFNIDNSPMVMGVICQRANRIVRDAYLGFLGDLMWIDTQGTNDPEYSGIGSRYVLAYLFPDEIGP